MSSHGLRGVARVPVTVVTRGTGSVKNTWFRAHSALSRAVKLFVLLVVISAVLSSTVLFEHTSQVLILKTFLVFILSLIPGWLYLQFIDSKAERLYDEYVINLFRLKIDDVSTLPPPPKDSAYESEWRNALTNKTHSAEIDSSENLYLKKFEAVYGAAAIPSWVRHDSDSQRPGKGLAKAIRTEAFSPVIMTTALLAIGWIAFVQPELYRELTIFKPLGGTRILPDVPVDPLRFGFLGAYTFILQSFVRRYFASDLKTRAFVHALMRVILVAALVMVVHPIWAYNKWPPELEIVFAFTVGYFPDFALRLIKRSAMAVVQFSRKDADEERFPLAHLDGLNLWYETRLVEEGVENMQNLSTTNIVDLMLHTRTPVARLVDWIDQSFLYLRTTKRGDREELRQLGIRNATDLIRVYDCSKEEKTDFNRKLRAVLQNGEANSRSQPSLIDGIRYSLEGEGNLVHVRHYRAHEWLEAPPKITTIS